MAGSKIPQSVIEELSNDQDFLSMDSASQDEVMGQIESKFGHIQKPESILQRAIQSGGRELEKGIGFLQGKPSFGGQAEDMRQRGLEGIQNPFLRFGADVVTDPTTYAGGGTALAKGSKKLVGKVFPFISKESRVGFTKGVEKSLVSRRNALTRGFGRSLDKSKAKVDLGGIMDEGSEITEFTMKEAQDLKNAITMGVPEAVKKGVRIDPKHFGSREIAGMISDRMKKADPEMALSIEKYGKHAENFKSAISPIKGAKGSENIFGSNLVSQMFRGGGIPEKAQVGMQEFAPRIAKKVSGAKINENIFRGLRGTAISTAVLPLIPNILKRAFVSEVSK